MAEQWYYAQQGQRKGPVSEREIRQLISSSQLQPTDLVWKQGMAQWTKASQFFPPPPSDPNAPPPVPQPQPQNPTASLLLFWNQYREHPLFIGVLLVFCFPVGLFLVWKHSVWTTKTKWIWTGAFAALVVVAMVNNKDERRNESVSAKKATKGSEGGKRSREATDDSGSTKPSLSVNAFQLVDDYKNNEVAADKQYKGKVLEVSGFIESIGKDLMDTMYVSLGGGGEFEMRGVQCYFADSETDNLATLSKGQQITITGRCDGLMGNVLLKECAICKHSGD